MEGIILAIVGGLIVAAITAVLGYLLRDTVYRAKVKGAPSRYAERLGQAIERGYAEGIERAVINARVIVSLRNEMRARLVSVSQTLNSEISTLQGLLGGASEPSAEKVSKLDLLKRKETELKIDPETLFHYIEVLHRTWPTKKEIIEVEVRKLLTELGLETDSGLDLFAERFDRFRSRVRRIRGRRRGR